MPKRRHWFFDSYKYQDRTSSVSEYVDGEVIKPHSHPWHQLVYASQGVMTVRTSEGAWVVPINRGVSLPAGTRHSIEISGTVSVRTLYLVPRMGESLPDQPRVIGVSPLLRELILQMVALDSMTLHNRAHAHFRGQIRVPWSNKACIAKQAHSHVNGIASRSADKILEQKGDPLERSVRNRAAVRPSSCFLKERNDYCIQSGIQQFDSGDRGIDQFHR